MENGKKLSVPNMSMIGSFLIEPGQKTIATEGYEMHYSNMYHVKRAIFKYKHLYHLKNFMFVFLCDFTKQTLGHVEGQ